MQAELVFTHTESIKKCCVFFYNMVFFDRKEICPSKKKPETVSLLAESGFFYVYLIFYAILPPSPLRFSSICVSVKAIRLLQGVRIPQAKG